MTPRYRIEAIENWPHEDTPGRRSAPFRMTFDQSLALVRREVDHLGGDVDVPFVLRMVCEPRHVRKDGMLRNDAWIGHPGVILSVRTWDAQQLEFATDRYEAWRDNVHAIGLSLEALRGVDRWGVTHGAQYSGFKALPAGTTGFGSAADAELWMADALRRYDLPRNVSNSNAWRALAAHLHPDKHPERADDWHKLNEARTLLAAAGAL